MKFYIISTSKRASAYRSFTPSLVEQNSTMRWQDRNIQEIYIFQRTFLAKMKWQITQFIFIYKYCMQTNIYLTIITIMSTSCLMNPSHHFTHPYPHKYFYNAKKKANTRKIIIKEKIWILISIFTIWFIVEAGLRLDSTRDIFSKNQISIVNEFYRDEKKKRIMQMKSPQRYVERRKKEDGDFIINFH